MGRGRRLAEEGGIGKRNGDWRVTSLGGRGGRREGRRWRAEGEGDERVAKSQGTTDIEPFDLAHMSRRNELYVVVLTASS